MLATSETLAVEFDRTTTIPNSDDGFLIISEAPDIEFVTLYSATPYQDGDFRVMNIIGLENLKIIRETLDRVIEKIESKKGC